MRAEMSVKSAAEFAFWSGAVAQFGDLRAAHQHYAHFYTTHFGLSPADYVGKRVLDIGCGPAGSLEWADGVAERVGLDVLAALYQQELRASTHKMRYVAGCAECIPFLSDYFDVVCAFNSLDHLDDLHQAVREIKRVTKPGGLFLLLTEVHPESTITEPLVFSWDVVRLFEPEFGVYDVKHYEKNPLGLYQSLWDEMGHVVPFYHSISEPRWGVLSAKMIGSVHA